MGPKPSSDAASRMMFAEKRNAALTRVYRNLNKYKDRGHPYAKTLQRSDHLKYTDEKLAQLHEADVRYRSLVFEQSAGTRDFDLLSVFERFIGNSKVNVAQIVPTYNLMRAWVASGKNESITFPRCITAEHLKLSYEAEQVLIQLSGADYDSIFAGASPRTYESNLDALRGAYVLGTENTRSYITENPKLVLLVSHENQITDPDHLVAVIATMTGGLNMVASIS